MTRRHIGFKILPSVGGRYITLLSVAVLTVTVGSTLFASSKSGACAFCSSLPTETFQKLPMLQQQHSPSALALLRPDWMRRAGRIEQKRKERREMFEALRKRQDELGIKQRRFGKTERQIDNKPKMYIVVSPKTDRHNDTKIPNKAESTRLAVYPFVPEDEVEANDDSNVLDWLEHGEIVKAIRTKEVADDSVPPPSMAVVAATMIYNVPNNIRTDILWIEHDKGGWSPTIVDGETRLIPIDDDAHSTSSQSL